MTPLPRQQVMMSWRLKYAFTKHIISVLSALRPLLLYCAVAIGWGFEMFLLVNGIHLYRSWYIAGKRLIPSLTASGGATYKSNIWSHLSSRTRLNYLRVLYWPLAVIKCTACNYNYSDLLCFRIYGNIFELIFKSLQWFFMSLLCWWPVMLLYFMFLNNCLRA
jgi:hypothetical protein